MKPGVFHRLSIASQPDICKMRSPKKSVVFIIVAILCLEMTSWSQCFQDRHNTSSRSAWISCIPANSPNPARGSSHWLLYDFHYSYALEQSHLWNYNHPDSLTRGAMDLVFDVSDDGNTWTEIASVSLPMASGTSSYEGSVGPDFGGVRGRYVLVTIESNHGDPCVALGEIRVGVQDEIDCVTEHLLTGDLTTRRYQAMDFVQSDGRVLSDEILRFEAGNHVVLHNQFEVALGADLTVTLDDCTNNQ